MGHFLKDPSAEQTACQAPKPILLDTGSVHIPYEWCALVFPPPSPSNTFTALRTISYPANICEGLGCLLTVACCMLQVRSLLNHLWAGAMHTMSISLSGLSFTKWHQCTCSLSCLQAASHRGDPDPTGGAASDSVRAGRADNHGRPEAPRSGPAAGAQKDFVIQLYGRAQLQMLLIICEEL